MPPSTSQNPPPPSVDSKRLRCCDGKSLPYDPIIRPNRQGKSEYRCPTEEPAKTHSLSHSELVSVFDANGAMTRRSHETAFANPPDNDHQYRAPVSDQAHGFSPYVRLLSRLHLAGSVRVTIVCGTSKVCAPDPVIRGSPCTNGFGVSRGDQEGPRVVDLRRCRSARRNTERTRQENWRQLRCVTSSGPLIGLRVRDFRF
jgi:hypothetical protein